MIRIVVAEAPDDHLCRQFRLAGVAVVAVGPTSFQAVDRARRLRPDVLVINAEVAVDGGLPAVQLIRAALPSIGTVVYGGGNDPEWLAAAEQAGVDAYVGSPWRFDDLLGAVFAVAAGHTLLTPESVAAARRTGEVQRGHGALSLLSDSQRNVVKGLASGLTRREIADSLGVSAHVVDTNLAAARRALAPNISLCDIVAALGGKVIDLTAEDREAMAS